MFCFLFFLTSKASEHRELAGWVGWGGWVSNMRRFDSRSLTKRKKKCFLLFLRIEQTNQHETTKRSYLPFLLLEYMVGGQNLARHLSRNASVIPPSADCVFFSKCYINKRENGMDFLQYIVLFSFFLLLLMLLVWLLSSERLYLIVTWVSRWGSLG